jgi:apolipoprotein N-acyltransferase
VFSNRLNLLEVDDFPPGFVELVAFVAFVAAAFVALAAVTVALAVAVAVGFVFAFFVATDFLRGDGERLAFFVCPIGV